MDSNSKPVVRFAPSPTGYLHIGGARTALYNYLIAKKYNGKFILRIEDTDLERSTPESIEAILEGMKWLGLEHTDGPYYQTKRFDLYQEHIDRLIVERKAYPCFCTADELDQKRSLALKEKRKPKYDRTCYHLTPEQVKEKLDQDIPHVIRFFSPDNEDIIINDLIKGEVIVNSNELDDLIIRRTDKSPTYNITVVIDDATMGITHVIRGDDHLNNTPRQIQLYQALGYDVPLFAHVPMILGEDKKRLSKRHGATSVMAYHEMGYLPEALLNYLVRLGWSHGDQEIFSMEEMIQLFDLKNVSKSAGVFNPEKLDWINSVYIRQTDSKRLAELVMPFLRDERFYNPDHKTVELAVEATKEKVKTIEEFVNFIDCFFIEHEPDEKMTQKFLSEKQLPVFKRAFELFTGTQEWTKENNLALLKQIMEELELGFGKVAGPLRAALSRKNVSPGIEDLIFILGKTKVLERLKKVIDAF